MAMLNRIKKPRIYVSTTAFLTHHLDEILDLCDQWNIDGLELSAVDTYDLSKLFDSKCNRRYLVHNYFPPSDRPFLLNLASQNTEILERSIGLCCTAVDLSSRLGCEFYAAHAGYTFDLPANYLGHPAKQAELDVRDFEPYEKVYQTMLSSVRYLTDYSKGRGVKFLIENHVCSSIGGETVDKLLPMTRAEELWRLAQDVSNSNFGLLIDMGHLNVSATALKFDKVKFVEDLAPYIAAFHLSDNDGQTDQHLSFDDKAWFFTLLKKFPEASLTIELNRVAMEQIINVRRILEENI